MGDRPRIGIVGLGLIGGSLAKAFRRAFPDAWICGVDRRPDTLARGETEGVLDEGRLFGSDDGSDGCDTFEVFADCGFVFVCTPVDVTARHVARVARHCRGIVTDVGSCKTVVMRGTASLPGASGIRFIGGHPMAGSERVGYAFSRPNLYENAIYVLCVPEGAGAAADADARALAALVSAIGALPVFLAAEEHDRLVGLVSHLPHVAASALAAVASREGAAHGDADRLRQLAAGGFRDITRIASANPDLWAGIAADGAQTLRPALDAYIAVLSEFRDRLGESERPDSADPVDRGGLAVLFEEGRAFRDSLVMGGRGALETSATLVVQLDDRTGALARIATLLGDHGIGIRNLGIVNSRGYEGGCLHVQLDETQLEAARRVLQGSGHECV
jgi:prephenate dehydrogenase